MNLSENSATGEQTKQVILPGATIGIIGGGQLGQMMALAAVSMGFKVVVLDPTAGCPASLVAEQIVAGYDDAAAVAKLARQCDVITYEFENVNAQTLGAVLGETYVPQGTKALETCQDRLAEKAFLVEAGIPIADFAPVDSALQLRQALSAVGMPAVLKTNRGGYDGKGQVVIRSEKEIPEAEKLAENAECVLEAWVDFAAEVSVIVAGNPQRQYFCFPVAENVHVNNILHQTIVPARIPEPLAAEAQRLALRVARQMGLVGAMGVEMFVGKDGNIFVNELAPRPHNSGHYTIEACSFSQFEAHIRAVCGWPLAEPKLLSPAVMTNVLGQNLAAAMAAVATEPDWNFHLYGKTDSKTDRKMGHVTCLNENVENALSQMVLSNIWV